MLTASNIRALVKLVDEEIDGVAKEQRQRLETIEAELVDVSAGWDGSTTWRRPRNWTSNTSSPGSETTGSDRRSRRSQAEEARALLSQRREVLDDVETITAYAMEMSDFLNESELTERRAFIESFVKEIVVMPDNAVVRYTIPMPEDSPIGGWTPRRWP